MRRIWFFIGYMGLMLLWYAPVDARAAGCSQVFDANGEQWAVILCGLRNNTLELQVASSSDEDFVPSRVEALRRECREDPRCARCRAYIYVSRPEGARGFQLPTLTWQSEDFPLSRQLAHPALIVLRIEVNALGEIIAPVRVLYSEAPFLNEAFIEFVRNNLKISFAQPRPTFGLMNPGSLPNGEQIEGKKEGLWKKEVLFIGFEVSSAPPSRWPRVITGYFL